MAQNASVKTVEAGSFSMDYLEFGHGENTLVILPGLSVQSVMLSAQAIADAYQLLADDFTIIVLDGRKELPATYTVRDMAQDTAAAFQALGIRQACVLGVSMGGMAAIMLASQWPSLVHKLVLCSMCAHETELLRQTCNQWIKLAKAGKATELYLSFGKALYPNAVFEQSRNLLLDAAESVTADDLNRFITLAEGMSGFDVLDDLQNISCPVFLVGSADDQVLGPGATELIAEHLNERTACTLHMYDGYGHAAYDIAPDFKERILRFLKSADER